MKSKKQGSGKETEEGVVGRTAQQEKSKPLKELSSSVWEIYTLLVHVMT
jgi:hypothetical protein